MLSMCHFGRNCLPSSFPGYHLKENIFHFLKRKKQETNKQFHTEPWMFPQYIVHLRFGSDISFIALLFIALACTLDVFIPSSKGYTSGMRCIWAGLLLCQENNPLMTGQHFHPSQSDLSEVEVALSLRKITLGTNKARVWGVIIVCSS